MAITSNANWSAEPFTLDKMLDAIARMPPPPPSMFGNLALGPAAFDRLARGESFSNPLRGGSIIGSAFGLPMRESPAFPHQWACQTCDGTGVGEESTYCPKCNGAGEIRAEGMMTNDRQSVILTSKLPRKFEPSFPVGLVPAPKLSRGLP